MMNAEQVTTGGRKHALKNMMTEYSCFASRWVGIALILTFALLYASTLDNGLRPGELQGGDLITHQYAQVQGRPSNAPGYPLYTMGGWLWFRLGRLLLGPNHNPIPILSSYSTFWALIALWLLYRLILEVTDRGEGGNWPVAALATAFYGVTYFFWYYAVTTEQYTSAVAWTLAVILVAFRWERAPVGPRGWSRRDRYLLVIAFLTGVGLAHMVTVLFIIPPLLWFVLTREPKLLRRPKFLATVLGLAALPLLSYIYVYVGGACHPEWRGAGQWTSTWQWFWSFISTSQGRSELTWSLSPFLTQEFPSLTWGEMTWPGLVAGLLGLAVLRSAPRVPQDRGEAHAPSVGGAETRSKGGSRRAIMLYATLAIYLVFCWIDRLGNWYQVIMPVYALLALGSAVAADWIWRWGTEEQGGRGVGEQVPANNRPGGLRRGGGAEERRALRATIVLALVALVAYRGMLSYPRADSRDRPQDTGLVPGWAILADDPAPGTAILGTLQETLALNYLTEIWEQRPDLHSVTSDQARAILAAGAPPLAVTRAALPLVPAEVSPDAHYSALGRTLVAVSASPNRALLGVTVGNVPLRSWTHDFGSNLRLLGGRLIQPREVFGNSAALNEIVVLLAWQARANPAQDWSVSVRLTQGGAEIAQLDQRHPVFGAYPTTRWSPGEIVADVYPLAIPDGANPDGLTVILYRQLADGSFVNLDVARFPLQG